MANNESVLVDDALLDERHIEHVDIETGVVTRSMMSIPLRCKGASIGVLNVVDQRSGQFTQDDVRLLERICKSGGGLWCASSGRTGDARPGAHQDA